MPSIYFHQEDINFHLPDEKQTVNWILKITADQGYTVEGLNFIFCSDNYLYDMNMAYLKHETLTDIITFDQSEQSTYLEGDVFISIDRVRENSQTLTVDFDVELHRVIIHGVLHLMGYNDKTDEEKDLMRKKEEACLSLRPSRNNP